MIFSQFENFWKILIAILAVHFKHALSEEYYVSDSLHNGDLHESWFIGPFEKLGSNPILYGTEETEFLCPVSKKVEKWESLGVFNPSAVVKNGTVYLFYRALDLNSVDKNVTSRIGLLTSEDGLKFSREKENSPILYPTTVSEMEVGCQDPRVFESEDGTFVMIYTGSDGSEISLKVATSKDLINWTQHGFAFKNKRFRKHESRSASIVTRFLMDRFIAVKVNELYWMYWWYSEDNGIYFAKSTDLINWEPILEADGSLKKFAQLREGEPGPQAILKIEGILLMYNGREGNQSEDSNGLLEGSYTAGRQVLFDINDPTELIEPPTDPFLIANHYYEANRLNRSEKSIFLSGLICFKGKWILYYGAGNHRIAVATKEDDYCLDDSAEWDQDDVDMEFDSGALTICVQNISIQLFIYTAIFFLKL